MPHTTCPHCGKGLKFPESLQGKRARCPACREVFLVQEEEDVPELTPIERDEEEIPELAPLKKDKPIQAEPHHPKEDKKEPPPLKKRSISAGKHSSARKKPAKKMPILPFILGGGAIVAVVILVILFTQGEGTSGDPGQGQKDLSAKRALEEERLREEEQKAHEKRRETFYSKSAKATTAEDLYQLAMWAKENDLAEFVETTLKKALTKNTNHEGARKALGFVRNQQTSDLFFGKEWLTPEQAREIEKEKSRLSKEAKERQKSRDADPYLLAVDQKIAEIKSDSFFEGIDFSISEDYRPFLIFIEEADLKGWHKRQLGELLTAFFGDFQKRYKARFELPDIEKPLVVISFKTTERYNEYGKMRSGQKPTSLAHYEPFTKHFIVHGTGSESYPYDPIIKGGTVTHEATHQLIDIFTIAKSNFPHAVCLQHWFQEGFAEFSGFLIHDKVSRLTGKREYKFSQFHDSRMQEFEAAVRKGEYFSFDEMIGITTKADLHRKAQEKNPKNFMSLRSLFYAQAWSFVWFCNHYKKGKYKEKFLQYMGEELTGNTGLEVFYDVFGEKNVKTIGEEWWEFTKGFMILPENK